MKIEYLADHQEAITTVATWYFDEWGYLYEENTIGALESHISEYLNRDLMPLMLLAYEKDELVGVAQLKYYEMRKAFPDYEHWLGGVYVKKPYRQHGIATTLAKRIISIAASFDIHTLYLQTEDLTGGLYAKLGWKPIQEYQREKILVQVMEKKLTPENSLNMDT